MSQNITITAVRNGADDVIDANSSRGAGPQLRTSDHDGISAQVTVTIKAVAEPENQKNLANPVIQKSQRSRKCLAPDPQSRRSPSSRCCW